LTTDGRKGAFFRTGYGKAASTRKIISGEISLQKFFPFLEEGTDY